MLRFRNLSVTPNDPVESWGPEGVLTAIERGGLIHLQQIMRAVVAAPLGPVSQWVREAARCSESPIAGRMAALSAEFAAGPSATVARRIRDAINRSGHSLRWISAEIGTSATRLSTYATGKVQPAAATLLAIERAASKA